MFHFLEDLLAVSDEIASSLPATTRVQSSQEQKQGRPSAVTLCRLYCVFPDFVAVYSLLDSDPDTRVDEPFE